MATSDNIPGLDPSTLGSLQTMTEQLAKIADSLKKAASLSSDINDEMGTYNKSITEQMSQLGKVLKYQTDLTKGDKKRLESLRDQLDGQKASVALANQLGSINKAGLAIAQNQINLLKEQGKYIKANAKEWLEGFKNPTTGKFSTGQASSQVMSAAQKPEAMLDMAGPWGMLLKFIVETIDGVRKMRSEMMTASAASGHFADGLAKANVEAMNLTQGQTEFMAQGLDLAQVADVYKSLKATGIEALGAVSPIVGQLSDSAQAVISFSKATGESFDAVSGRFASFIRNFGIAKQDVKAKYLEILQTATAVAQKGIMTTQQYMQNVMSLADAFKDVGMNVMGVNKILSSVSTTMQKMGRPLENIQKVAQGIAGISKAGEGWQVFMAKMAGSQGGYAQSLFAAQQRGPGGALAKPGQMDPMKMIEMARTAILKPTQGIGDQATRQLMIERMGGQFGMDTETTQVFQKLSAGTINQEQAAVSLKSLQEAAKKNNMDAKGMFDIIRGILTGLIAKPIIMIYRLLSKWTGMGGGTELNKMDQALGKGAAGGALIKQGGMLRVHANEVVAGGRVVPAAQVRQLGATGGGGGEGTSITVNVNMDANSLHKAFQEAENKTVVMLRKQHKAAFGG